MDRVIKQIVFVSLWWATSESHALFFSAIVELSFFFSWASNGQTLRNRRKISCAMFSRRHSLSKGHCVRTRFLPLNIFKESDSAKSLVIVLCGTVTSIFSIFSWVTYHDYKIFCRRTPTMIYVRESHVEKMGRIQDVPYEILNVLEFNRFQYILACISILITCMVETRLTIIHLFYV